MLFRSPTMATEIAVPPASPSPSNPALTVTVTLAEPIFPLPSLALQFTNITPSGKVLQGDGMQVAAKLPAQRSLAVAEKETTAPALLVAVTVRFAGTLRTGGVVSTTVSSAR